MSRDAGNKHDPNYILILALQLQDSPVKSICIYLYCIYFPTIIVRFLDSNSKAMWSATVEYGQRIAPPGCVARMQALVNGIYCQVAMGIGTAMWGPLVMQPPRGLGFQNCFRLDAASIVIWGIIWQMGLMIRHCSKAARRSRSAAMINAEQPLA